MIEIEIDGKTLEVQEGSTIIEVADAAGIYIPRFCYHKHLSVVANCRMCLVEVEKVGKPLPACATAVTSGMKIYTRSKKTIEAQRSVMEFLLINHPLDCPICDQGGECELQDLSLGFGRGDSDYCEPKRSVASENIGPLIETWMTRCIHCTRCVRFGDEIAGLREMGATGRGEDMEIGTYVKHFLKSEISGNIIDICPVGALTNKPARYNGRSWEYREHPTIAPHDALGGNIFVHSSAASAITKARTIMRAVPRECEAINETWASDRDRFSVHGLYHKSRVTKPRVNRNGEWVELEWQRALDEIVDRTQAIIQQWGPNHLAGLASPQATLEELYLFQKMLRGLGCHNIDHRLRTQDFRDQAAMPSTPKWSASLVEVESLDTIVLIGSHVRYEQPLLAHRIRKAVSAGAQVLVINPMHYEFTFDVKHHVLVTPTQLPEVLTTLTEAVADVSLAKGDVTLQQIAQRLAAGGKVGFFLGEHAMAHPNASLIRQSVYALAMRISASVNMYTEGPNSVGAWLTGCVPHRQAFGQSLETSGANAREVLCDSPKRGYFLLNTELEFDTAFSAQAMKALHHAGLVVCMTPFVSDAMLAYADFILPICPFTETSGTYVNAEGVWQSFQAAVEPEGESKPAWKLLRVLANFFELPGFDYQSTREIQDVLQHEAQAMTPHSYQISADRSIQVAQGHDALYRLTPWPMYRSDALVRRSHPLQESIRSEYSSVRVNQATAHRLGFKAGERLLARQEDTEVSLPLCIDDRLADGVVYLPAALEETAGFGMAESVISLVRGQTS